MVYLLLLLYIYTSTWYLQHVAIVVANSNHASSHWTRHIPLLKTKNTSSRSSISNGACRDCDFDRDIMAATSCR